MDLKEFKQNDLGSILRTTFLSLFTSFITFLIVYFLKLRNVDNFLERSGFFLFFAIISYSLIMPSLKKLISYGELPCMGGMMVGMTIGMIAGFLPGFFVGATNGMFYGSLFGMAVGITFGVWSGKCCGIMGVMEGLMAGFMGGLMGAMTSVMLYNDNLKFAGIVLFLISAVIITCLNFMIYRETKSFRKKQIESELVIVICSFILTAITIWLMVFGPRSALFQ